MFGLITRVLLILVVLLTVMVQIVMSGGHLMTTPILVNVVSSGNNPSPVTGQHVRVRDLDRGWDVDIIPEIEHIHSFTLSYQYDNHAWITTRYVGRFGVYLYDWRRDQFQTLLDVTFDQEDVGFNTYNVNIYNLSLSSTLEMDVFTMIDPITMTLLLYDAKTFEAEPIYEFTADYPSLSYPANVFAQLSPDGRHLLIMDGDADLMVMNLENRSIQTFPVWSDFHGQAYWHMDGQYIVMTPYSDLSNPTNGPIRLIDFEAGIIHPLTETLMGYAVQLSMDECDRRPTLVYKQLEADSREVIHVLDLETGETYNVSDHPALVDTEIGVFIPMCDHLILTEGLPYVMLTDQGPDWRTTYIMDVEDQIVQQVEDTVPWTWRIDVNQQWLQYVTQDVDPQMLAVRRISFSDIGQIEDVMKIPNLGDSFSFHGEEMVLYNEWRNSGKRKVWIYNIERNQTYELTESSVNLFQFWLLP